MLLYLRFFLHFPCVGIEYNTQFRFFHHNLVNNTLYNGKYVRNFDNILSYLYLSKNYNVLLSLLTRFPTNFVYFSTLIRQFALNRVQFRNF